MARFYGKLKAGRGEATRCGSSKSGMVAKVSGWDLGVRIEAYVFDGRDRFEVYRTGGSNDTGSVGAGLLVEFDQDGIIRYRDPISNCLVEVPR